MAEMTARFKPGAQITGYANAASIVEGRFVKLVGDKLATYGDYKVGPCGAGEAGVGVAERSADHSLDANDPGRRTSIVTGGVARVTASGAITAGDFVQSAAAGKAATATTGTVLGIAMNSTTSDGDVVEVFLTGASTAPVPGTGNAFAAGTQQAHIADPSDPAALTVVASAGEATAADLTTTTADLTELRTAIVAANNKIDAILLVLEEYGMTAAS